MSEQPITHLVIQTHSSDENDNGDCDYCLVPVTAKYVSRLLDYMDQVIRLRTADEDVQNIHIWDGGPMYFRYNDKLEELRDVDGNAAVQVPRGEAALLAADPKFDEDDFQRVECKAVVVSNDTVWWQAYVKHTDIKVEAGGIEKATFLRILRSLGGTRKASVQPAEPPVHPAIQRTHDLLYLDLRGGREFYNPDIMRS